MTRFVLVDLGTELGDATADALRSASSVPLRLVETVPPWREGQIVHIRPGGAGAVRPRDILLCRCAGEYYLRPARDGARAAEEALGRVVAISTGPARFSVERGLLRLVPPGWLPRAVEALDVVGRLRHPLTPPPFQGGAEACLAGVREKYDRDAEVRAYSRSASAGLEPLELDLVRRYVKPGGRLLDIGCGAGREALGFARAGFEVTAIDIAPAMIEAARRNAEREGLVITFRPQSATDLDDPPGSYDGAYCGASIHHIPGRALRIETLRRIRRSLTSDGVLVLVVDYRAARSLLSRRRLVDLLRALGRTLPGPWKLSEPGDRHMRDVSDASDPQTLVFFHDYRGPVEVRSEVESAGFEGEEVAAGWWVCSDTEVARNLSIWQNQVARSKASGPIEWK